MRTPYSFAGTAESNAVVVRTATVRSGVPMPVRVMDVPVTLTALTDNRVRITPDLQSGLAGRCSVEFQVLVKPGSSPNRAIEVSWNNGDVSGSGELQLFSATSLRIGQLFTSYNETVTLTTEALDQSQQSVTFSLPSLPISQNWDADQFRILAVGQGGRAEIVVDWTDIGRLDGSITVRKRHGRVGYRCQLRVLQRLALDSLGLHPGWNLSLLQRQQVQESSGAPLPDEILEENQPVVVAVGGVVGIVTGLDDLDYSEPAAQPPATKLSYLTQPSSVEAGVSLGTVTIRALRADNSLATDFTGTISVALTIPGGATLSGTTSKSAVGGVASFTDLSVDLGASYTLTATATGLTSAVSSSFTITAPFSYSTTFGADLYEWWRGSLGTVEGDPGKVITWEGQNQGIQFERAVASATAEPTLNSSGIGNQPTLEFDGTSDWMDTPAFSVALSQPVTIMLVFEAAAWADGGRLFDGRAGAAAGQFQCLEFPAPTVSFYAGTLRGADSSANWVGAPHTMIVVFNGSSSAVYRDGGTSVLQSGTVGTGTMASMGLACGWAGGDYMAVHIAEVAIIDGAPTAAQLNEWLAGMQDEYGISYTEIS